MISKQKEIFNELVDERLEEITNLDKKVNSDNLICRYKCRTADVKFDKFDNALDLIDEIRKGEISLTYVKNNQAKFKANLGEIKKKHTKINQKSKKASCIIFKYFTKYGMRLLNLMMIILQFFFFFYLGFLSRTFTIHGTAGEGGGYVFNSSLPFPPASETLKH